MQAEQTNTFQPRGPLARVGLVLGAGAFVLILIAPQAPGLAREASRALGLPAQSPEVMEVARSAQATAALGALMVIWWITEAIPLPATALLPGFMLPLLHVTGVRDGRLYPFTSQTALAGYASPVIFLFLAGFLLAGAMSKTGLDRRASMTVLAWEPVRRSAGRVLLAVIAITGFFSMWISNTATAAMMLPIAAGIIAQTGAPRGRSSLGAALMLGVAWAASLGGVATIIGTPPNGIVVAILRSRGHTGVDFVSWLSWGVPVSILGLLGAWAVLMCLFRPRFEGGAMIQPAKAERTPLTREQWLTLIVFGLAVVLWVSHPFWERAMPRELFERISRFGEYEVALFCALLLFVLPVELRSWRTVLDWRDSRYVDWGTLLLFGGGIALAGAMFDTGLADWASRGLVGLLGGAAPWVYVLAIIMLVNLLTELVSNTAVAGMFAPLLIALAPGLGLNPVLLCVAAAMGSSLAFMLPIATPPNALVYGTGHFTIAQMARAGVVMTLVSGAVVALVLLVLVSLGVLKLTG